MRAAWTRIAIAAATAITEIHNTSHAMTIMTPPFIWVFPFTVRTPRSSADEYLYS
jgi:hypothetical protein